MLVASAALPADAVVVRGHDFNSGGGLDALMAAMASTGLQASALGAAVAEVNRMLAWRLSREPPAEAADAADAAGVSADTNAAEEASDEPAAARCEDVRCKIFLGYTSNLVTSGVREHIRFLVQHRLVDVLVTTAGGIEEDLIKCLAPAFVGEFSTPGAGLRARGLNRAGNILLPNDNYCKFEDWVTPILDAMLAEQTTENARWTPSRVIARLGREIGHEDSICYWAARNGIPIFCPALTDGSLGDMMYFHSYRNPGLVVDIVEDVRAMNDEALKAAPRKTGVVILGGGVPKHHICNANLMRNGADYAVYINTAQEYDGSDSGARPDEAVSWGKIRADATPVKVHGDASIIFPLLVSQTFVKEAARRKQAAAAEAGGSGAAGG